MYYTGIISIEKFPARIKAGHCRSGTDIAALAQQTKPVLCSRQKIGQRDLSFVILLQ
jgi:hypothetical protein